MSAIRISPRGPASSDGEGGFGVPGRTVGAGRGAQWVSEGWALFRPAPLIWIVILLLMLVVNTLLQAVPVAGGIVSVLLGPVLGVGLAAFSRGIAEHGAADVNLLFAGFRDRLSPLLGVALLNLALLMGIALFVLLGLLMVLGGGLPGDPDHLLRALVAAGLGAVIVALLALALLVPVMAAAWYAPALVFFAGLGAGEAMRESLRACLCNWAPMLVYGALGMLLLVLGSLPLGLGLLVVMPVLAASYYPSFVDIFGRRPGL